MDQSGAVVVNVKLSARDIYRFQVSHMLSRFWLLLLIPGIMVFGVAFLLVTAHVGSWASAEHAADAQRILVNLWPLLAVFGFIFLVAPYFSALSVTKNPNLAGGSRYAISTEGVVCDSPHGHADIKWPAFVKARELSWAFVLYPQNSVGHLLPKKQIEPPGTTAELREIIRKNVAKAKLRKS
jgi:hypothetical protein